MMRRSPWLGNTILTGRGLAEQSIVVGVGSDPEPDEPILYLDGEGSMSAPDPSGPNRASLLEAQRWMPRILLEALERLVREPLDLGWQSPV
jgi:hypothetical protein